MINWYVEGVLPAYGSINILGGNTHAGKSTLLYSMVRSLRYSAPFLGRKVRAPEHIAVVLADRSAQDNPMWEKALEDELIDGFLVATANDDYIETVRLTMKQRGGGMQGHEKFKKLLSKLPQKENMVLIVDVFTTGFLGNIGQIVDVKDNMDVINHICSKHNICLLGTGYGVKPKNDKAQRYERYVDRLIGASPLRGGASTVMYLATREESTGDGYEDQVLEILSRHAPVCRMAVRMGADRIFEAVPLTRVVKEPEMPACYKILNFVPIIATNWKEVYDAYCDATDNHVTDSRFRNMLTQLVHLDEVEIPERGKYRIRTPN